MSMNSSINIAMIIKLFAILPLSFLLEGVFRKLLARMQNRVGPSILQPFYDGFKLFKKSKNDSRGQKNIFFKLFPFLYFLASYSLFLFLLGAVYFHLDFIFFIYMIMVISLIYILLGLVSNSPFGTIGSMREMLLNICYDVVFMICILTIFVYSGVLTIKEFTQNLLIIKLPLAGLCMITVAIIETRILGFDVEGTEPEIISGIYTEYSGKDLFFIESANHVRLLFCIILLTKFLFNPVGILSFIIVFSLLFFIIAFSRMISAKPRTDQTFNLLVILLLFSVIEFIRIHFLVW